MSESANESTESPQADGTETPEVGLIADEQLPEDLQPEKNPLAADPEDDSEHDSGKPGSEQKVEGLPDMGQPS